MKRFVPEISLGLATAAVIHQFFAFTYGHAASPFLLLVMASSGCAGYISLMRRLDENGREKILETARSHYKEARRQSEQRASPDSDSKVAALAMAGRKIDAIKLHRQLHGGGLREAKDHVDSLVRGPIGL